ncbi:MAG: hypothetical protein AAF937_00535 [Planctomycetota bacterium]
MSYNVPNTFMVRCEGGDLFEEFVASGYVAIGGEELNPDLSGADDYDAIRQRLESTEQWTNPRALGRVAGIHLNFKISIAVSDRVITYDPSGRRYQIGRVTGEYE